jgi:hypothetical protein
MLTRANPAALVRMWSNLGHVRDFQGNVYPESPVNISVTALQLPINHPPTTHQLGGHLGGKRLEGRLIELALMIAVIPNRRLGIKTLHRPA